MNRISAILMAAVLMFAQSFRAHSQDDSYDVFVPISKYMVKGDAEKLSAWFADNLEVSILDGTSNSSKSQARRIIKSFFDSHTPRSFAITHTAGKGKMKYAVGDLNAGGESFVVTIFVSGEDGIFGIQQLKIDRIP